MNDAIALTVTPELPELIRKTINDAMDAFMPEIRADIDEIKTRLTGMETRVQQAESRLESAPQTYVRREEVDQVRHEIENRNRQTATQIASLVNMQSDNHANFGALKDGLTEVTNLKTQVNSLSNSMDDLTRSVNRYVEGSKERHEKNTERLKKHDEDIAALQKETKFLDERGIDAEQRYVTTFTPVRDFVMGNALQKPLREEITDIRGSLERQSLSTVEQMTQVKTLADYIEEQKKRAESDLQYWRNIRLRLFSPAGLIVLLVIIVTMIMLINAIDLGQFGNTFGRFMNDIQKLKGR